MKTQDVVFIVLLHHNILCQNLTRARVLFRGAYVKKTPKIEHIAAHMSKKCRFFNMSCERCEKNTQGIYDLNCIGCMRRLIRKTPKGQARAGMRWHLERTCPTQYWAMMEQIKAEQDEAHRASAPVRAD